MGVVWGLTGLVMIIVNKSETADTRTCDYENVTRNTLLYSSLSHIEDVGKGLAFFSAKLTETAAKHDSDKIADIDWFHSDFKTGFRETGWWDNHRQINRHHLAQADGIPEDVNLIDVLEYITDCVMAGMARSGSVTPLTIDPDVLMEAFHNTVELLASEVVVDSDTE
jgi:hypothetical protein